MCEERIEVFVCVFFVVFFWGGGAGPGGGGGGGGGSGSGRIRLDVKKELKL